MRLGGLAAFNGFVYLTYVSAIRSAKAGAGVGPYVQEDGSTDYNGQIMRSYTRYIWGPNADKQFQHDDRETIDVRNSTT